MPNITDVAGVTRANAYQIPPEQLQQVENSRRWDDTDIAELALDIVDRGQLVTVIVNWDAEGHLVVVDGRRRVAAIRYINENGLLEDCPIKVRCEMFKGQKGEAFAAAAVTNVKRKGLTAIDLAHCITTLEKAGKTRKEIAKTLDISEPLISRTMKLLTLSAALQKDIHRGKLSAEMGYELADLDAESRAKALEAGAATTTGPAAEGGEGGGEGGRAGKATRTKGTAREAVRKVKRDKAERGETTKGSTARSRKEAYNLFKDWAKCEDGTIEEPIKKLCASICGYMDGKNGDRAVLARMRELAEGE